MKQETIHYSKKNKKREEIILETHPVDDKRT